MTDPDDYLAREFEMKKTGTPVAGVTIKNGKLVRIHKLPAGQRKNAFGKAKAEEAKWRTN